MWRPEWCHRMARTGFGAIVYAAAQMNATRRKKNDPGKTRELADCNVV